MTSANFDLLIVGAGAAGMMAALEAAAAGKHTALIEALPHTGGRMRSLPDPHLGICFELGAEFIHGNLPLTKELCAHAGIALLPTGGNFYRLKGKSFKPEAEQVDNEARLSEQLKNVDIDLPVNQFIDTRLAGDPALARQVRQYVSGYYAADPARASTLALRDEWLQPEAPEHRLQGGYGALAHWLEQRCREKGVHLFLDTPVTQAHWKPGAVELIGAKGNFRAVKALFTVSLGVLQQEALSFFPALPEVGAAARGMGFGPVVKILLAFDQAFWKMRPYNRGANLSDAGFLFAETPIPTWWTQYPQPEALLTGWVGGPEAKKLSFYSDAQLLELALDSLAQLFDAGKNGLRSRLRAAYTHNWNEDPFFGGAYSYEVVGAHQHRQTLLAGVADTLFFAGEALHDGPEIGTVEAALQSGRKAGQKLVAGKAASGK